MSKKENVTKLTITQRFTAGFERWMPDSMTIAFLLVIIVGILAKIFTGAPIFVSTNTQTSIADSFSSNFWNLLTFTMQMVLITALGNVFASAPFIKKWLRKFCEIPKSTLQAYIYCSLLGFVLSWIHWAIGWMGCIVIGKQMLLVAKERGMKINVPSFVAAIFCTALVGGSGIAASPVLFAATPGYLKGLVTPEIATLLKDQYSVASTVMTVKPLITVTLSGIIVLAIVIWMSPERKGLPIEEMSSEQEEFYSIEVEKFETIGSTPAQKIANSRILMYTIVAIMAYASFNTLRKEGIVGISINTYNYLILTLALAACVRPRVFTQLFIGTIQATWAFIIQYPFYAGIFGIIVGTGLDKTIADFFLSFATKGSWNSIAMLYSAILNVFIPSAGSKFIVEAPYVLPITLELGTKIEHVIVAYSYGDCATNMLTPFWWVLPCGLFKTDYHKVLPYAVVASISITVFYFVALLFW